MPGVGDVLVHDWSRWARAVLVAVLIVVGIALVIFLSLRHYEIDLLHLKFTPVETDLVKTCRERTQALLAGDQRVGSDILAIQAQVAAKERDLNEIRQKCV